MSFGEDDDSAGRQGHPSAHLGHKQLSLRQYTWLGIGLSTEAGGERAAADRQPMSCLTSRVEVDLLCC